MATELKDIEVKFISLVKAGANKRQVIWKSAGTEQEQDMNLARTFEIAKTSDTKRMVYGVVYAPDDIDTDGEYATAAEIEKASHAFMRGLLVKNVDTNHDYNPKDAFVAESWLLRAPDPLFKEEKEGAWAVGIKIDDDELWREVQSGSLKGLSMAGTAVKVAKSDQAQQSEEDQSILRRLAKAIKNIMNHKEEEEMTKDEIQKCVNDAVAPLKDAVEKAPKPHSEEAMAKIIKAAVDEVLKPVLDRLEKVEKSTSGSKQNEENINKDEDPIAIGKRIAKMIKGE